MRYILLAVDFDNLCHRVFHGYGENVLTAPDGVTHVTVPHGVLNMVLSLASNCGATHVACAFESRSGTERRDMAEDYKAGRAEKDEDLRAQMELTNRAVGWVGWARYRIDRYEADDALAALARVAPAHGFAHTYIASGDKDLMGAVAADTTLLWMAGGIKKLAENTYTPARVEARYGVTPAQFADWKALAGDPSDNISGVPGIGERTASALIARFGSLEGIYADLGAVTPAHVAAKLAAGAVAARHSLALAQLHPEAPLSPPFDPDAGRLGADDRARAIAALSHYGLRSVIGKLPLPLAE
jgi:DNA polymerase-1